MRSFAGLLATLFAVLAAGLVHAAGRPPEDNSRTSLDPGIMKIDETRFLGQPMARETRFVDESGRPFTLGDVLGKPVILALSYYGCDGSCPIVNRNLAAALEQVERFRAGRDYRILTVSFDPNDSEVTARQFVDSMRGLDATLREGWRFAVLGEAAPDAHERFAGSVGFRFFWSRIDKTFLHPNVLVFLTPEGRVARYVYGTPLDPRTVELALIEADWGRISGSASAVFDMITGACFSYNYSEGRYQPNYALFVGLGSLLLGVGLAAAGLLGYRRRLARRTVHAS